MIAGLPFGSWVLMAFAVVPGIVLVAVAYRVHGKGDARDAAQRPDGGAPPQATQRGEGGRG